MASLVERDSRALWHPYTQMHNSPLAHPIVSGRGVYLFDDKGHQILDAISSWWVNLHGHCHPYIVERIEKQVRTLEHVLFAGFTHEPAIELSERLLALLPQNQERIFYSDNGSTAVEVAIKMAVQYWANRGIKKTKILHLSGAYHGDTFGAMSASHRGSFTKPFGSMLFETEVLPPLDNDLGVVFNKLETLISEDDISAFIFEPLVQGVAGFKIHSRDTLEKLIGLCKANGVLTIADEVMTGFGRTGGVFASLALKNLPDIMCLSKGITGGFLPLGATSCSGEIYDAFLSEDKMKTLFHGHSYTANPIACAAGCASLELLTGNKCIEQRAEISSYFSKKVQELSSASYLSNARSIGTIFAADMGGNSDYFDPISRKMAEFFYEKGVLIRPLGNVFYVLPQYCIESQELNLVFSLLEEFFNNGIGH